MKVFTFFPNRYGFRAWLKGSLHWMCRDQPWEKRSVVQIISRTLISPPLYFCIFYLGLTWARFYICPSLIPMKSCSQERFWWIYSQWHVKDSYCLIPVVRIWIWSFPRGNTVLGNHGTSRSWVIARGIGPLEEWDFDLGPFSGLKLSVPDSPRCIQAASTIAMNYHDELHHAFSATMDSAISNHEAK